MGSVAKGMFMHPRFARTLPPRTGKAAVLAGLIIILCLSACSSTPAGKARQERSPLERGNAALAQKDYFAAVGAFTGSISRLSSIRRNCLQDPDCPAKTQDYLSDNLARAYTGRAYAYLQIGGFEPRVEADAQRALSLRPDQADAHLYLGIINIYQNNPTAAWDRYRSLLELKSSYAQTLLESYEQAFGEAPSEDRP